ncbi:eukaryotic translation initiation factor 4E transporter [Drosophila ficusphila]|uniref:eukaryotic translation initiation factor 4E transporter n=1 Tax=Drosophila ficusphila TaxID=30025 RepID=UPI0007E5EED7|nr:eukaryotic translation initiation factor 4E transporter [Drosophila ficusphila]
MDVTKSKSRYTRADLLALRYESKSRQRPQCTNRTELHTLGFWKINFNAASLNVVNNFLNQNKHRLSPEADNSTLNCSNNGSISSRRALRNRERANNYYQRFIPADSLQAGGGEEKDKDSQADRQSFKLPVIDHRSISSSHLMPAFAKKRFAAVTGGNGVENSEATVDTSASYRRESKGTPVSPSRKTIELDSFETRLNYTPDHDVGSSSSPTFSTTRQERRIGSGRLLPRNDNWEYKGQKSKEITLDAENDSAPIESGGGSGVNQTNQSQHRHRTFSGRLVDRVPEPTDRRFQYDTKRTLDRQGVSGRRLSNKESNNNQSRGKRGNSYQILEEPEWFSGGPTSQLETIDLHGFDELENTEECSGEKDYDQFSHKDKKLNVQATNDKSSRRSSNASLNDPSPLDDMKHIGENKLTFTQNLSEATNQNNHSSQLHYNQSSESEFNFDAFLNIHPLDHSLMINDGVEKGETKGTSRFTRWFRNKEAANNHELSGLRESQAQEKLGIPSVKDLEAQMTKVEMATESASPMAGPFPNMVHVETPIARDTEAFKKLLQQLGSQARQPNSGNDVYHMINHSNVAKPDQFESSQQNKLNDGHQQETGLNVRAPNIANSNHIFTQKQHLIQSLLCGEVSMDFLEKEFGNPSTPAPTREAIAAVLRDYSQTKRNPVSPADHQISTHASFLQAPPVHQHYSEELISQNCANQAFNQHIGHGNCPTPLAFTPTSVLRKMTADKDTTQTPSTSHSQYQMHLQHTKQHGTNSNMGPDTQPTAAMAAQPRMILGGGNFTINPNAQQMSSNLPQCRSHPVVKWTSGNMQMPQGKSFGRPILKGGLNSLPQQNPAASFTPHKIEMQPVLQQMPQQQLRFKSTQPAESILSTENVHQDIHSPAGWHQLFLQQQQQQARQQPRHRVIYGEMHRQANLPMSSPIPGYCDSPESVNGIKSNSIAASGYHREDQVPSPTTNQLAQWFSPELLARASAGKLPLLNMSQALSLEEFERSIQHSSAVVHN